VHAQFANFSPSPGPKPNHNPNCNPNPNPSQSALAHLANCADSQIARNTITWFYMQRNTINVEPKTISKRLKRHNARSAMDHSKQYCVFAAAKFN